MSSNKLLSPHRLGDIYLNNRVVMAPMTRLRAIQNLPNELIAEYYAQRAGAGLIITEGVSPSPNGAGYARMPGIYNQQQTREWKITTEAVHSKGGHIFMQLMHSGRIGHPFNLPEGSKMLAPSAIQAGAQMWTDSNGMQNVPVPAAMSLEEIQEAKNEFVTAAKNAIAAGFDGVELHGANGYLLEQFISPFSNQREDHYGGSIENRTRVVLEIATEVSNAIGKQKVGIRLSPYGIFNDMPHYSEIQDTYSYLAEELDKLGIVYIHLVDHSTGGAPAVPVTIKRLIGEKFHNTLILSGGYTKEKAEADLQHDAADLIAFGKPFINNPDLVERFQHNWPLSADLDVATFYTAGEKGFTDYPVYENESITA